MSADVVAPLEISRSAEETQQHIDKVSDDMTAAMSIISPFAAYTNKEFQWPSIYEEIDEMLEACILTYPVADLRTMANEGKLKNDCVSKLPLSSVKCVDAIAANLDAFKKFEPKGPETEAKAEATPSTDDASAVATAAATCYAPATTASKETEDKSADESYVVRLDALKALHARQLQAKADGRPFAVSAASFIAFSDYSTTDELAYAVSIDKTRKRVTICFRGSASESKWATSETWMKSIRNPASKRPDQPQEVKVHSKIYDCLFSPSSSKTTGPKGQVLNEYQAVLQRTILMALKRNPGFKLYVTGHSLGAAIATLFAFESAAADDSIIPKPVTCVSIGGPYVGDSNFREAHQWLERQGKLRHIRVSNHQDLVTTVPVVSFKLNPLEAAQSNVGTPFKHVGMNIRLHDSGKKEGKEGSYEVAYPKVQDSLLETCKDEIERGWRNSFLANLSVNPSDYWTWPWHGKCAYNERIQKNKSSLEKVYLDALYKSEDIVGGLVGQI